jgi:hypothetical protein
LLTITRSARSTAIPDFVALLLFHEGHRFFAEDVNFIRPHFKDFWWTNFLTLTASIAFICVDSDIPVTGAILKTIIGDHVISAS